ncbi:MAG: ribosome biogenesis GTPase Der [Pseudomonadota bacterium]
MALTIAIIGRPNVGKSTLFNRLVGKRLALVDDRPGVTRDRREGEGRIGDLRFLAIDTAGLEDAADATLEGRMRQQTEAAIAEADVVLFLIDARAGVTPVDEHFADLLRRQGKPVVLVANKAEGRSGEAGFMEAYALGLGDPVPLSAEHGEGIADLYEAIRPISDAADEHAAWAEKQALELGGADADEPGSALNQTDDARPPGLVRVTVIGRPNTGKSTLINRLIGEDRLLVGPEAGITRDSISLDWTWTDRSGAEHAFRLADTAGLRRKARVTDKVERLSVADTLRALRYAEVVVGLIDVTQPFEKQDLQIIDLAVKEGRALVIALSKWDLIDDPDQAMRTLREQADRLLPQIRGVPLIPVSGLTGKGLGRLMQAILDIHARWDTRIGTAALNRWFEDAVTAHPPPAVQRRRLKIRYITQAKSRPPTFVAFCSRPDALPASYRRYIVNGLKETFDLGGVAVRLILRKTDNPYVKR